MDRKRTVLILFLILACLLYANGTLREWFSLLPSSSAATAGFVLASAGPHSSRPGAAAGGYQLGLIGGRLTVGELAELLSASSSDPASARFTEAFLSDPALRSAWQEYVRDGDAQRLRESLAADGAFPGIFSKFERDASFLARLGHLRKDSGAEGTRTAPRYAWRPGTASLDIGKDAASGERYRFRSSGELPSIPEVGETMPAIGAGGVNSVLGNRASQAAYRIEEPGKPSVPIVVSNAGSSDGGGSAGHNGDDGQGGGSSERPAPSPTPTTPPATTSKPPAKDPVPPKK